MELSKLELQNGDVFKIVVPFNNEGLGRIEFEDGSGGWYVIGEYSKMIPQNSWLKVIQIR